MGALHVQNGPVWSPSLLLLAFITPFFCVFFCLSIYPCRSLVPIFFSPVFRPVSFYSEKAFNIPVVKQKLGTIKCYFILLCGCMVWHTGHSCWMDPRYGIKAEAFACELNGNNAEIH